MRSKPTAQEFLHSKKARVKPVQYAQALKKAWLAETKVIKEQCGLASQLETQREPITEAALNAAGVKRAQLEKLMNGREAVLRKMRAEHTRLKWPYERPTIDPVPQHIELTAPTMISEKLVLDIAPGNTESAGEATAQWLGPPNAFRLFDELHGKGGGLPYHRKENVRAGWLLFQSRHTFDKQTRLDSVGLYFAPVYPSAGLYGSQGNYYRACGYSVFACPPSVAEVKQKLFFQVLVNTPGGSDCLIADADEPGAYVDARERGGDDWCVPRRNMPPSLEFPVSRWYPKGTEIVTFVQLTYWIRTFGKGALATVCHNLYALPYLCITHYEEV